MRATDQQAGMNGTQALAYAVGAWEMYLDQKINSHILTQAWSACCGPLETNHNELQLMVMYELKGW